jgi:hypothetical protein
MHSSITRGIVRALVMASLVAAVPSAVRAQVVVPGDTVRIATITWKYGGTLLALDSATLLMHSNTGDTLWIPRAYISRSEVLRGRRRRGPMAVVKGGLIGLGVGATVAALVLSNTITNESSSELRGVGAMVSVVVGTTAGTVIGGVAALGHVKNWESFDARSYPALSSPQ